MANKVLKIQKSEGIAKQHPLKRLGEGKTQLLWQNSYCRMRVLGSQDKYRFTVRSNIG